MNNVRKCEWKWGTIVFEWLIWLDNWANTTDWLCVGAIKQPVYQSLLVFSLCYGVLNTQWSHTQCTETNPGTDTGHTVTVHILVHIENLISISLFINGQTDDRVSEKWRQLQPIMTFRISSTSWLLLSASVDADIGAKHSQLQVSLSSHIILRHWSRRLANSRFHEGPLAGFLSTTYWLHWNKSLNNLSLSLILSL